MNPSLPPTRPTETRRQTPLDHWRRRLVLASLVMAATIVVTVTWSLMPLRMEPFDTRVTGGETSPPWTDGLASGIPRMSVDRSLFAAAPIWNPQRPPEAVSEAAKSGPQRQRPKIDLIGIIREQNTLIAAIYVRDRDETVFLRAGDHLGPYEVESIDREAVTLRDGTFVATWRLSAEASST